MKLLIVEDDIANSYLMKILMERWGYPCNVVQNGNEAIRRLGKEKYDVILMDLIMPEMNGYKTIRHIRESMGDRETPIIVITANAQEGEREKCLETGANDFVTKPFHPVRLYIKINTQRVSHVLNLNHKKGKGTDSDKVISLGYLKAIADMSDEKLMMMMMVFIQTTSLLIRELIRYGEKNEWKKLKLILSQLRSSVSPLCNEEAMGILDEIEECIEKRNMKAIRFMIVWFRMWHQQMIKELGEEIEMISEDKKPVTWGKAS